MSRPDLQPPHVVHVIERAGNGCLEFALRLIGELDALGCRQTVIVGVGPAGGTDLSPLLPLRATLVELADVTRLRLAFARELTHVLRELCTAPQPPIVHLHAQTSALVERLVLAQTHGRARCYFTPHSLPLLNAHATLARASSHLIERIAGRLPITPVARGTGAARRLARAERRPAFAIEEPVEDCFFEAGARPSQPPAVVGIGRAAKHNAPNLFTRLALRFEIDEIDARFVWIGDGDTARLRAAGVQVLPRGDDRALAEALAAATVCVQTSPWEGFPAALVRAMAVGLPCVASDAASHRDVIVQGETGFLVHDLDELDGIVRWLLDAPALRRRLGAAARQAARQRFGCERFRAQVAQLYGVQAP